MALLTLIDEANISSEAVMGQIRNSIKNLRNKVHNVYYDLDYQPTGSDKTLQQLMSDWIECSNSFISALDTMSSSLSCKVLWHPEEVDMVKMYYHSGDSPWSFWLTYNMVQEIAVVEKMIEENWQKGKLNKLNEISVGKNVICCENKVMMFRGLIIAILNKSFVKVLNIDKCIYKMIKRDCCYEMINELCKPHANVIHCCLIKQEFEENMWSDDLTAHFQNILRDSRLTAKIVETSDSCPPKFLVELYAFNVSSELESNISCWVSDKLLPAIKNLENVEKDELYINIDEEILDPFISTPDFIVLSSPEENSIIIKEEIQNEDLTDGKPRNRLAHLIPMTDSAPLNNTKKSLFKFESVLDAPEFLPKKQLDSIQTDVQPLITDLENITLNSECEANIIPENRITLAGLENVCCFYALRGACWNPGCQKEHNKASGNWFNNLHSIYTGSLNALSLPEVGSEISVEVTHVVNSYTFYCNLPSCYSVFDENDGETLEALIANLNKPESLKEMPLLASAGTLGQKIIALSQVRNMWLRASIHDIYDDDLFQVCFVDFGNLEQVSLKECREMLPQYLHLPFQAVCCSLSKLRSLETKDESGRNYLSALIKDQEIKIKVVERCTSDACLEVIGHTSSGFNLNKVLVDNGYCSLHNLLLKYLFT